jgi:hydroxymethylbilane synthase
MLPCAGQGALGIEIRSDATALRERLAALTHRPTWLAVAAERAVSRGLGGSCSVPLAAHARWLDGRLELHAALGHAQQPLAPLLRAAVSAPVDSDAQAQALGEQVVVALRAQGAAAYLAAP